MLLVFSEPKPALILLPLLPWEQIREESDESKVLRQV